MASCTIVQTIFIQTKACQSVSDPYRVALVLSYCTQSLYTQTQTARFINTLAGNFVHSH